MRKLLLAAISVIISTALGYCQDAQDLIGQVAGIHTDSKQAGNDLIAGFSFGGLMGGILFASIGVGAFIYGKRASEFRPMITGALLMGYPYFVKDTIALYAIGIALTVALFVWRE